MSDSPTMSPLMSPTMSVVEAYRAKGWEIFQHTTRRPDSTIYINWNYKSPRMTYRSLLPETFTEEQLLRAEARDVARDNHGASFAVTFNSLQASLLDDLAEIYYERGQGRDREMPVTIVLESVEVPIRGRDWAPSNPVVSGQIQDSSPSTSNTATP